MSTETRYLPGIELRSNQNKAPMLFGYAAVFNSRSDELSLDGGRVFREIVKPGAFAESLLSNYDVLARFEHSQILGRTSNGTLRLFEDARGLRYEVDLPDTTVGRDTAVLVRRGDIHSSSFSFSVRPGGDTWRRDGATLIRELRRVKLLDVSPVAKAAYPATDVALRSWQEWQASPSNMMRMRLEVAERS